MLSLDSQIKSLKPSITNPSQLSGISALFFINLLTTFNGGGQLPPLLHDLLLGFGGLHVVDAALYVQVVDHHLREGSI